MADRDTSSVFNIAVLDCNDVSHFDPAKPWIFETDEETTLHVTEDEACAKQRAYRSQMGFNPITGEAI